MTSKNITLSKLHWSIWLLILGVLLSIVAGIWLVGSPQEQRKERFDARRISDLNQIQYALIDYWQAKNTLPESLSVLHSDIRGIRIPVDPQTGAWYEYEKKNDLSFVLCANFSTDGDGLDFFSDRYYEPYAISSAFDGVMGEPSWKHGVGRTCFERTIDPDFFAPPKIQ